VEHDLDLEVEERDFGSELVEHILDMGLEDLAVEHDLTRDVVVERDLARDVVVVVERDLTRDAVVVEHDLARDVVVVEHTPDLEYAEQDLDMEHVEQGLDTGIGDWVNAQAVDLEFEE
jgi:hypothetical protein